MPRQRRAREIDEQRILWAAGDIVENRPPLSRWHPDYAEAFKAFSQDQAQTAGAPWLNRRSWANAAR